MRRKKQATYSDKVFRKIVKEGTYSKGTREIIGFSDQLKVSNTFWPNKSGANVCEMHTFFGEVLKGNDSFAWGPYQSRYYTFLRDSILKAASQFIIDGPQTRRAVISFPEGHCFSSIQLLVRPGSITDTSHRCTVVVSMRSCNAIANFPNDLYLSFLIAKEVLMHGFGIMHEIKISDMSVSIGSLHYFIAQ